MIAYERLSVRSRQPGDPPRRPDRGGSPAFRMSSDFVLDAGALVAAERSDRRWVVLWDHLVRFGVNATVDRS